LRLIELHQLSTITGQVVTNRPVLGESLRHGQRKFLGLTGPAHAIERYRSMHATEFVRWKLPVQGVGDLVGHRPLLRIGIDLIPQLQHCGMGAELWLNLVQLLVGLQGQFQLQPALRPLLQFTPEKVWLPLVNGRDWIEYPEPDESL